MSLVRSISNTGSAEALKLSAGVTSIDLMSQPPPGIVQGQSGCPDRVGLQNFLRDSSPQVAPQTKVSSITYKKQE